MNHLFKETQLLTCSCVHDIYVIAPVEFLSVVATRIFMISIVSHLSAHAWILPMSVGVDCFICWGIGNGIEHCQIINEHHLCWSHDERKQTGAAEVEWDQDTVVRNFNSDVLSLKWSISNKYNHLLLWQARLRLLECFLHDAYFFNFIVVSCRHIYSIAILISKAGILISPLEFSSGPCLDHGYTEVWNRVPPTKRILGISESAPDAQMLLDSTVRDNFYNLLVNWPTVKKLDWICLSKGIWMGQIWAIFHIVGWMLLL